MPADLKSLLSGLPQTHVQEASRLGLALKPGMDADTWSQFVAGLAQVAGRLSRDRDTVTAWLGDLLAYSGGKYRGQITEYAMAAGLDPGTLRIAKLVCSRIPVLSRLNTLSWTHHCEVGKAFKAPAEIKFWLNLAEREGWSVGELRKRIRQHLSGPTSPDSGPAAASNVAPFALLRELRAVCRFVENHAEVWQEWSPETCELALSELQSIVGFIEEMKTRTAGRRNLPMAG